MARQALFVYDDRELATAPTSDLVGRRAFGDITFRRERLLDGVASVVDHMDALEFVHARADDDYRRALARAHDDGRGSIVWRASAVALRVEALQELISRLLLAQQDIVLTTDGRAIAIVSSAAAGIGRLDGSPWTHDFTLQGYAAMDVAHVALDVSDYRRCLRYLSGGFDARHFNAVDADGDTVTKRSTNIEKIRAEHDFFNLLPAALRRWFVAPYDLTIGTDSAAYRMERLYVADVALQWIHGSVERRDFELLMDRVFAFLDARPRRTATEAEVAAVVDGLYAAKLEERMAALKASPAFPRIEALIASGTRFPGVDAAVAVYRKHFARHRPALLRQPELAIIHGDLCFSNMLFERHSALLKLIDPRGATTPDQLWSHASYDLAKLSHSVLGDYDWINNAQYRIEIAHNDAVQLEILDGGAPRHALKRTFVERLEANGLDPRLVRTCEASLFLSMLPLHLDRPNKVLALLLNAIGILEELDRND